MRSAARLSLGHSPAAPSTASGAPPRFRRVLVARLRHEREEDEESHGRGGAEGEERGGIAEMVDDVAGGQAADRRADPLSGRDRALREIETAGAAHDVGDDQRRKRLIDARPHAVEQLDANEPEGVVRQNIERRADRQDGEGDEKDRPSSPGVGVAADEDRDRQHHALRRDHAERHHRRRLLRELKRKLLADQRQERRVGEVEQHGAEGENHQRTRLEQDPISGRRPFSFAIGGQVSRPVVVDRVGWNGEYCRGRQDRRRREP